MGLPVSAVRVLMLHRDLSPQGGVPRVLLSYARHCDPRHVQLHVGSFAPIEPPMAELFAPTGALLHSLGDDGYLRPARALSRLIDEQALDMVVATSLKSLLVARLAAPARCRVLFWIHAIPLIFRGPAKRMAYHWAARNSTIIFISKTVQRAHGYAGHKGREVVVLNGVDDLHTSELYGPGQREAMGIPREAFVVGYTAEFIAWKQHRNLLEAFARISAGFPELHLLLIGTGELWEQTRAQAAALPDGARIHFLGPRHDAGQLLGVLDVYTQPSNGEGISIAVVEAMLARRAMLVSDAGALPEIVDDGDTGLIFRAGDADELGRKILALAADAGLRKRLGERAREVALERFSPARFAECITAVLEEEMTRRR